MGNLVGTHWETLKKNPKIQTFPTTTPLTPFGKKEPSLLTWLNWGISFSFFLCSQHVPFKLPNGFPICSPKVVPNTTSLEFPYGFAQSPPPLLTYIGGAKGDRHSNFPKNLLPILVSLHSFNSPFFPQWTNQIASVVSLYVEPIWELFGMQNLNTQNLTYFAKKN